MLTGTNPQSRSKGGITYRECYVSRKLWGPCCGLLRKRVFGVWEARP